MTRTVPAALLSHYQSGTTTLAWGLLVVRRDATQYGWTSADRDATISGVTYRAAPGLDVAALVSSAGFGVDNTEVTMLADDSTVTRADMLAGKWDGAEFTLFRYNWATPSDGRDIIKRGRAGNWQPRRSAWVAELRGLRAALQQTIGTFLQPVCRYRLGDSRCTVALGPYTHAGTVTAVASTTQFTAGAFGQAEDRIGNGVLTWSTGANAGVQCKVRTQTAGGVITLTSAVVQTIQIGDTFSAVAGCRGRLLDDCKTKFANVLNFGGEPHLPGQDQVTAP